MLAGNGFATVANVSGGAIVGEDFRIPTIAVVLLELQSAQTGWTPGGP